MGYRWFFSSIVGWFEVIFLTWLMVGYVVVALILAWAMMKRFYALHYDDIGLLAIIGGASSFLFAGLC